MGREIESRFLRKTNFLLLPSAEVTPAATRKKIVGSNPDRVSGRM
jgi:hypothetical protein